MQLNVVVRCGGTLYTKKTGSCCDSAADHPTKMSKKYGGSSSANKAPSQAPSHLRPTTAFDLVRPAVATAAAEVIFAQADPCTYIQTYIRTYTYIHACTHVHTYIHT